GERAAGRDRGRIPLCDFRLPLLPRGGRPARAWNTRPAVPRSPVLRPLCPPEDRRTATGLRSGARSRRSSFEESVHTPIGQVPPASLAVRAVLERSVGEGHLGDRGSA